MAGEGDKTPALAQESSEKQVSSEGSVFLSPPAFQLTAGDSGVVQKQEDPAAAPQTTTVDIQTAVGAAPAPNLVSDVAQVQTRLVELGIMNANELIDLSTLQPTDNVPATSMGRLIAAITYFQRAIAGSASADGKIDPGGGTEGRLNSNTSTQAQNQQAMGAMVNHDRLDPVSIRIIQNVLGGRVDGDLTQDLNMTGAWAHQNETDSQTRIQNFQTNPTGYDGQPIAGAPANTDRSGWIEDSTVAQVFSILVGANQHGYALYLTIDFYEDYVDAANAANPQRLSLGNSLEVYYDANLASNFQAYEEMGGLRTVAVGPGAFTSAAALRTAIAQAQTSTAIQPPSGMATPASQVVDQSLVTADQRTTLDTGITQAVIDAAITYNGGFFTQTDSVRIIQALVGAPTTGTFDADTIRNIIYYQSAQNAGQQGQQNPANVNANGQLDSTVVDLMGRDLIARQEFNSAIQFAMDYFNLNVTTVEGKSFSTPGARNGTMQEVQAANLTSIIYDPNLAGEFASDANINQGDANERIRDVRGIGAVRIGQAAMASFTGLVTAISKAISDVARPGAGQTATEGSTRNLITPLADMSTFQVPYTTNWRANGSSGWEGARKGGRNGGHGGWDIYAPTGTPIRAVAAGTADRTTQTGYGSVVRLLVGDRVYFYAHLNDYNIPAGQTAVTQGQVLGFVGYTGNGVPQRPHLHFEIRSGSTLGASTKLNPDDYFQRPTKQRFYSSTHQDFIVTEIPNDTAFPYPTVPQVAEQQNGGND